MTTPRDFTLPEGCVVCGADLPVRVSDAGARAACVRCGWMGRPQVEVTHRGLRIRTPGASA
ncbi:hypothetical protein FGE12_14605 [Aggregicoccus sp. 17bor-14]|uniref:hypothetical protein n=1 Tax=Myxococcaceae TaxID=31 RepID=UPI00129CA4AB|nr:MULTISPECIES: hypothetical protein [Myxococcaceae]MBF5043624.1 hypothetical protein [Simulacricoccus sp. 17bor-14]MRI89383.1 hypothetical protein [Aggregicoccus sp. 17bor-14]